MKNILVTGGAGFIGSNFVRYLLHNESEARIVNLDALTYAGSLENLIDLPDPHRHTFVQGDITDQTLVDNLLHRYEISVVMHFAAETHVDRSIFGPEQFIQTNILGTFRLLEGVRKYWLVEKAFSLENIRFHHVSTDEVYGSLQPNDPPFSESTPYSPNSPYSASKAASDHLVRAYQHTYNLPTSISNCSNNYGPFQFPEKLIPLIILNALDGNPLPIYGDGKQIRDWLYVEDHCQAIWQIIQHAESGETYNIGGNNQPTNMTVVETICDVLDELKPASPNTPHASLIQHVVDRPGHDRRYAMDISRIEHDLGWRPRQTLTSGLLKTVQWYLDHPEWIDAIRKQQDYQGWLARNYQERGGSA